MRLCGNLGPQKFNFDVSPDKDAVLHFMKCYIYHNMVVPFFNLGSPGNPCIPNPCLNGGRCNVTTNGTVCTCMSGYSGQFCNQTQGRGHIYFVQLYIRAIWSVMKLLIWAVLVPVRWTTEKHCNCKVRQVSYPILEWHISPLIICNLSMTYHIQNKIRVICTFNMPCCGDLWPLCC